MTSGLPGCPPFEQGLLFGLLVGEGHFGGDGRQPQVTLRMHVRHERMFRWLQKTLPRVPALRARTATAVGSTSSGWSGVSSCETGWFPSSRRAVPHMDDHVAQRFDQMCARLRARMITPPNAEARADR